MSRSFQPAIAAVAGPMLFAPGRMRRAVIAIVAIVALAALIAPATARGGAEQIVITVVNEPVTFEYPDPCRGGILDAEGTESGVIRITELGDQGHHVRVDVRGTVDLYDDAGAFVGTWTYRCASETSSRPTSREPS